MQRSYRRAREREREKSRSGRFWVSRYLVSDLYWPRGKSMSEIIKIKNVERENTKRNRRYVKVDFKRNPKATLLLDKTG
jgi:hypothetical protein